MELKRAIFDAVNALGGTATISQVEEWIAANRTDTWEDVATAIADLCPPSTSNTSSQYSPDRFLDRIGPGRYRLRPGA